MTQNNNTAIVKSAAAMTRSPVVPTPFEAIERMAQYVAKSGLLGIRDPAQAVVLMLLAESENLLPIQAVQRFHIINGKPVKKADAMLADFQACGGSVRWIESSDDCVRGIFTHPAGGSLEVCWDNARVKKAQLGGNHAKFPQQMKRARCISEGVRAVFPGAFAIGIYTPEEARDFVPDDTIEGEVVSRQAVDRQVEAANESLTRKFFRALKARLSHLGHEGGQNEIIARWWSTYTAAHDHDGKFDDLPQPHQENLVAKVIEGGKDDELLAAAESEDDAGYWLRLEGVYLDRQDDAIDNGEDVAGLQEVLELVRLIKNKAAEEGLDATAANAAAALWAREAIGNAAVADDDVQKATVAVSEGRFNFETGKATRATAKAEAA